jgi:hypothetical protein
MSYIKTFEVMGSDGKEGRFVGNYPAKGFVYDKVKCAFKKIGEDNDKWVSDEEIIKVSQTKEDKMRIYNSWYKEIWWKILEIFTEAKCDRYNIPCKDKPCLSHRIAFKQPCPETVNIKLKRCLICGWLYK